MNKRFIGKFIVGLLLGLAVLALLAFNGLLLWVATGPRSLEGLKHHIEAALEPSDQSYALLIDEAWLVWDGWKHPIDIRLRNVTVMNKARQRFSTFPEISLGLDLLSLLQGKVLPTSMKISQPKLHLFQNEDRSINFGFSPQEASQEGGAEELASIPLAAVLAPIITPDQNSALRKLRTFSIDNADISVGNQQKETFFVASGARIVFKRNRNGISVYGDTQIRYDDMQSMISAQFSLPKDSTDIVGKITFGDLMPGKLVDLFANYTVLSALKFPISGNTSLLVDTNGTLKTLDFSVSGGKGKIESDQLSSALSIHGLQMQGSLSNQANDIIITQSSATIDGMELTANGTVNIAAGDVAAQGDVVLKKIPATSIHKVWPPALAPETRLWVTKNITDGTLPDAKVRLNIVHGDLAKPALPKEAIDAVITLSGQSVRYLPDHPLLNNVKGSVHVDGVSLDATIESADYLKQTKMSGGKVLIDDLNVDNPYIKVSFDTQSTAKDIVHFLGLPRLKHAKHLGLNDETIEGTVNGNVSVGFNFYAPKDASGKELDPDVTYEVTGNVSGIKQDGFLQKFDVSNASGTVSVNNKELQFKGSGDANGASTSEVSVNYLFNPDDKGFDTFIDTTSTAPVEALPRFGYPAFAFIKGALGVKASLKLGENHEESQATIDLTNTTMELDIPGLRWSKPAKEAATLELSAKKQGEVTMLPSLQLKGRNMDLHGSLELNKERSDIRVAQLDRVICEGTDLHQVLYEKTAAGYKINARGNKADMSAWMNASGEKTFSFERFPEMLLNADIKQVTLGESRVLMNVKGTLNCDAKQCTSADIAGETIDNKPFSFRIFRNPKGTRQLSIRSTNAGALLKAAGVFDSMDGGDMSVSGSYNDKAGRSLLKGSVDINDYTIKNAPVLANMLSLASLTGMVDTIRGKGIAFSKLRAPFVLSQDVITFKEAKTHGDAVGITTDGTITFPPQTLNLQGTLVPSYTLNNVFGKVPLVGKILTGGEGQGVFAARYTITGTSDNQDVSVNPLSFLTPGFLRGLFDVFDAPKEAADDA
jgi:hypothetical protein